MVEGSNPTSGHALTRSLADSISQRYPHRFDDGQLDAIRRALAPVIDQLSVLRSFRLTNADEPEPTFRAFRGEG